MEEKCGRHLVSERMPNSAGVVAPPLQPVMPPAFQRRLSRITIEHFGNAVVDLLACAQCFVSTLPKGAGAPSEQVRIGSVSANSVADSAVIRMTSKEAGRNTIFPVLRPDDPLAGGLIGQKNGCGDHSIVGELMASDGTEVVFAAGWRRAPFRSPEIAWLSRAIPVIWSTAENVLRPSPELSELQAFLDQLVSPAFVVDGRLRLYEANELGRKLLTAGRNLSVRNGHLSGKNSTVTEGLREALCNSAQVRPGGRWNNGMVSLSTERQRFAFAWIGALPIPHDVNRMLVIVPCVDALAGAKRIGTNFGLSFSDERIVARILCGYCPRRIGAELGLTEATVRTYTKRIMLKLGIRRQSELYMLYILTSAPFRSNL